VSPDQALRLDKNMRSSDEEDYAEGEKSGIRRASQRKEGSNYMRDAR